MRHAPALFQSRGANACADSETRARVSEVQVVAPVRWNASPQVTDGQAGRMASDGIMRVSSVQDHPE